MNIFDCHCHIEKGLQEYDLENVIHKNIIFNSIDSYKKHIHQVSKNDTKSLIFDYKHNFDFVLEQANLGEIVAFKIHSREQKLVASDYTDLINKLALDKKNIPVIIDAFYYDHHLENQPSLSSIIKIAEFFPDKKIIVAHCGGHKVLEYFFHLRTLKNIYYDLSFSLQYLSDSSCFQDLIKLIKYTDKSKIMFGSDYYWASAKTQFNLLNTILSELNLSELEKEKILFTNSFNLFKSVQ